VTPGGASAVSSADQYTYVAAPTVTGVSPAAGPLGGGTAVTLTGANLKTVSEIDFGSVAASLSSLVYNANGTVTVVSPGHTAGAVDVKVVTPGGTSTLSSADQFTYMAAPTVAILSQTAGPLGGGTLVTITGANLKSITSISFGTVAASLSSLVYNANGSVTIASPAHAAAPVDVTVVTPGGTSTLSSADQFTYMAAPTITGVSTPGAGPLSGGTSLTVSGANLKSISEIDFGSVLADLSGLVYNANGTITLTTPAHAPGTVDIRVVTPGGTSAISSADHYTFVAAPTVTKVAPAAGSTVGGTAVTITGASLSGVTAVNFGSVAASLSSVVYNANGTITVTSPAESAAAVDVTVTTLGGTSAISSADLFSYIAAPTATIAPAAGQANPATATPILFTVSFNEPVSGLVAAGIKLTGSTASGATVQSVTGSGAPVVLNGQSYYATWTVGVGGMSGSGNVVASVAASAATDAVGNHSLASASATVGFVSAPQVAIATTASQPTPINRGPLVFSVIFNQPVVGLNPGSFSFAGSTAPGVARMVGVYAVTVSTGAMSGSNQVYTVSVSGMTATGLVKLSLPGGVVRNSAGVANTASTGAKNFVFYDIDPATEALSNPTAGSLVVDTAINGRGYIDVSYSCQTGVGLKTATISDTGQEFTLSGAAAAGVTINGAATSMGGDVFRYPYTGKFAAGLVTVNFIAGSFQDNAGNYNKAGSYSFTVAWGLSINNVSVVKPASGKVNATFTVTLSSPATSAVTVKYATVAGTNTLAGRDFTNVSGTLVFSPGQTSKTIVVPVLGNATPVTSAETFSVFLSSPSSGTLLASGQSLGTCTITAPVATTKRSAAVMGPVAAQARVPSADPVMLMAIAQASQSSAGNNDRTAAFDAVLATLYAKPAN